MNLFTWKARRARARAGNEIQSGPASSCARNDCCWRRSPSPTIPMAGRDRCGQAILGRQHRTGTDTIDSTLRSAQSVRPLSPRPAASPGHRGRPGRQPLVHREPRQQDRPDHPGRRRHRVPHPHRRAAPVGITAGPDGNLWFTEDDGNKIGRITPRPAPSPSSRSPPPSSQPAGITAGPGRQPLVHRVRRRNKIGRITPAGAVTEFPIPTAGSRPVGDHGGPGRQPLVHREQTGNKIGRITPAGVDHRVPHPHGQQPSRTGSRRARTATSGSPSTLATRSAGSPPPAPSPSSRSPPPAASPCGITAGPDGNLWFTEVVRQQDRPDHARPAPSPSSPSPRPTASPRASRPARTATSGSPSSANQIGRVTVSSAGLTISPQTPLPTITDGVRIDGTTQPGIQINGGHQSFDGLVLGGGLRRQHDHGADHHQLQRCRHSHRVERRHDHR